MGRLYLFYIIFIFNSDKVYQYRAHYVLSGNKTASPAIGHFKYHLNDGPVDMQAYHVPFSKFNTHNKTNVSI